jgi:hypothetical protein
VRIIKIDAVTWGQMSLDPFDPRIELFVREIEHRIALVVKAGGNAQFLDVQAQCFFLVKEKRGFNERNAWENIGHVSVLSPKLIAQVGFGPAFSCHALAEPQVQS